MNGLKSKIRWSARTAVLGAVGLALSAVSCGGGAPLSKKSEPAVSENSGSAADFKEDRKYHVVIENGRGRYAPQVLSAGETTVRWIFPVPEQNSVGTLDDRNNGIAFMKFGGYGEMPAGRVVAKNYLDGGRIYDLFIYRFSPNYADNIIAYSINRVAVIADVKTGDAFYSGCGLSREDHLLGIRFLDPQKNLFVILKSIRDDTKNTWGHYLHIVKLEDLKLVDTDWSMYIGDKQYENHDLPLYNTWFVHERKLFVYDQKWHKVTCTDGKSSIPHPFSEAFNANFDRVGLVKDIAIHPMLPFAVIIEESINNIQNLTLLRWDNAASAKKGEQVISFAQDIEALKRLLGMKALTLAYQSFSPDGKWYVVGLIGKLEPYREQSPYFIAVPVTPIDKKHANFLDMDNSVVLGKVDNMITFAWTFGPTSYVASSDHDLLYKWDLEELPNAVRIISDN